MTRIKSFFTLLTLFSALSAGAQKVGLVMSGGGGRGYEGFGGERHSDRLRVGDLHGLDHRRAVRDRLYAGPDGRAVQVGPDLVLDVGADRIRVSLLLQAEAAQRGDGDAALRLPQSEEGSPVADQPDSLRPDRHGFRRILLGGQRRVRRRFRPAFRAVPLHCDRCGRPQGGRLPQRRSGQGDPRFDDHTVGFQTYQARLDAALRRRTVQ